MSTINSLIEQAQAGDGQAFEALLEQHYELLFKFAYKWCANREDAEDIAQQASVKLARGLQQFRFESSFSTWLYRLVINCAKDWQRSQARHQHTENDSALPEKPFHEPKDQHIFLQQLLSHIDNLAEGMKETVLLVHAEGFTHSEAASILGVKESTVSWRIHEIRKQLQLHLAEEDL